MTGYAQARVSNPSRYFETPDHVLSDVKLGHADKRENIKVDGCRCGSKAGSDV